MVLSGVVAGLDVFAWNEMERGNFLFQPIGGVFTMVLVVNALAVLGLLYTLHKAKEENKIYDIFTETVN